MNDLPVIVYEKYKISWSEDENTYFFNCSEVREFEPRNYIFFKDPSTGIWTTFELRETAEEGWLYFAIGDSGIKKPCKLLAIR